MTFVPPSITSLAKGGAKWIGNGNVVFGTDTVNTVNTVPPPHSRHNSSQPHPACISPTRHHPCLCRRLEQNFLCGSVPEALLNASQAIGDFQAMFPWSLPGCPCCTELEDNPLWCCARWTFANVPSGDPYNGGGLMELCNPDC